jgi:hypothetical protein
MIHFLVGFLICLGFMSSVRAEMELPFDFLDNGNSYKIRSQLGMTARSSDQHHGSVEVSTLVVEFNNLIDPSVQQYLNVLYDQESKPTHVQIVSFVCSGQLPISADALSIKLHQTKDESPLIDSDDLFIATGQPGEDIQVSQTKKNKSKIYDHFLNLVEERATEMKLNSFEPEIFIPHTLLGSLEKDERKILTSFFNSTSSSVNGCTHEFGILMSPYKLETQESKQIFKGIEISKKIPTASKYIIKWKI